MARYFKAVFKLCEVANRVLETCSSLLASHVVRNCDLTFKVVKNLVAPDGKRCSRGIQSYINLFLNAISSPVELDCTAGQFTSIRKRFASGACVTDLEKDLEDAATIHYLRRFINRQEIGVRSISFKVMSEVKSFIRAFTNGVIAIRAPTVEEDQYGKGQAATIDLPNNEFRHFRSEVGSFLLLSSLLLKG